MRVGESEMEREDANKKVRGSGLEREEEST